ncbi:MAG: hypothetical protein WCD79_00780 [Chthoniobacteraceae bacterium]
MNRDFSTLISASLSLHRVTPDAVADDYEIRGPGTNGVSLHFALGSVEQTPAQGRCKEFFEKM